MRAFIGRREFITLVGGAAVTWPVTGWAQQGERMRRVGVLMPTTPADAERQADLAALQERLVELGWVTGRNKKSIIGGAEATSSAHGITRRSLSVNHRI